MVSLQSQLVLEQNDGSELRGIVLDVEPVLLALDDRVASTDTDVVDTHLGFVATTKFELSLLRSHCQQMDVSTRVLVKRHRLKENVVS